MNAGGFKHAEGAFPAARLALFVSCFDREGAHSPVIIVASVLQVAYDNASWSCGLWHTVLATHIGDPSPTSLSTLIDLTEISDHACVGVQWRCNGLVFEK